MQDRGLDGRLEFAIDPETEPADLDQALAQFLLRFIRGETENKKSVVASDGPSKLTPAPHEKESS